MERGAFYGGVRRRVEAGGVTLAETEYSPRFAVPAHSHGHPFLCVTLAGSFTERFEGRARRFGPPELFYYPADGTHSETFHAEGGRLFNIQLGIDWLGRMAAVGVAVPDAFLSGGHDRVGWLAGQIYREFRGDDVASPLALDGYLLAAIGELERVAEVRQRSRSPAWLERARELLHARFAESIGLADVAAAVDVHPTHLARVFRRQHGCSIGDYVRRLRIERARAALADPRLSLSRIALDAGFADQSHFTRTFRRETGCSPAQYRRALRGGRDG
jgi:AraC family transcriptional regulator